MFLYDAELVYENSKQYNGADSNITGISKKILEVAQECVQNVRQVISEAEVVK